MLYRHVPGSAQEVVHATSLETYRSRFESETIHCVHCGESAYGYYDLDDWPYGLTDFELAYKEVAEHTFEVHGLDADHPHVRLRGDVCERQASLHICQMCGWWAAVDSAVLPAVGSQLWLLNLVAPAVLMELDVGDLSAPLGEVRNFLRRRYDARHHIAPRLFERVVASVFRDSGYEAEATAYSNDGGIDIVLCDRAGRHAGVQVKRWGRAVEVEQIRAFLGALMLGGYARGVFVSTSGFQRGAARAATACRPWASIELVDAQRFFDMLGIAQLQTGIDPEKCGFYAAGKPPVLLHSAFHLNSI
ncbi:restriction endonuclease [Luteimonas yindakuii]|uniref:restriction endonuclease n=1 Tax=Luteimonas yindakuii TaxID=2565782 RepID=UPI0010A58B74|nr:restriction endonuclease [Luteimonas yindakuii]QCO66677.1 restriction endonuclease [Luteimonas yindakuii]